MCVCVFVCIVCVCVQLKEAESERDMAERHLKELRQEVITLNQSRGSQ